MRSGNSSTRSWKPRRARRPTLAEGRGFRVVWDILSRGNGECLLRPIYLVELGGTYSGDWYESAKQPTCRKANVRR